MESKVIAFTKVSLPYGWLGNMSPFPIEYDGKMWRTTEALFQALRFNDDSIRELIREQKSPMAAKMIAKKNRELMSIVPLSEEDYLNMMMCLILKLKYHPALIDELVATGKSTIIEDVTLRGNRGSNLYWGALLNSKGEWIGENNLGKAWMHLRQLYS
jgi:predicted NAD-dependent protein-ADP-ribosyltransferase YbiA (DUF1768 family)